MIPQISQIALGMVAIPALVLGFIVLGEGLIRRDFSVTVKNWIMNTGVMVLFLLIGLVLYSDLSKTGLLGRYLP